MTEPKVTQTVTALAQNQGLPFLEPLPLSHTFLSKTDAEAFPFVFKTSIFAMFLNESANLHVHIRHLPRFKFSTCILSGSPFSL